MTRPAGAYAALLAIGAAWGLTTPLVKIATQGGHGALGIALWMNLIVIAVLGLALGARGMLRRMPLDGAAVRLYLVFGLAGTSLPQLISYSVTSRLPAGIMSIILSLVPVFALPLALAQGTERFSARRMAGVGLGAVSIVLLAAPGASLPDASLSAWVLAGALVPLLYAIEGAFLAASPARMINPFQVVWGGSVVALAVLAPLALTFGGVVSPLAGFGLAEAAITGAALLSMAAYTGYVLLLRVAGAVFGAQVGYTVTATGVIWAMLLLGERYPPAVWAALAALFTGLFLVQPRRAPAAGGVDVRA